jgi:uncharacterized repeat protein (TIGR01451 family)
MKRHLLAIVALLTVGQLTLGSSTALGADIFLPLVSPGDALKWEPVDDYVLHIPDGLPADLKAKLEVYSPELNINDYPSDRRSNSYVGDERYDRKGFSSQFTLGDPTGKTIRSQTFGLGTQHSWSTLVNEPLPAGDYPLTVQSKGMGKNGFGLEVGPGLSLEASIFTLNARGQPGETIEVAKFKIPRSLVGKSIRIFNYDADGENELGVFVTLPSGQRKSLETSANLAWATNEYLITPELIGEWKVGVKIGPKPKQYSNAMTFKLRSWPSNENLPVRLREGDPVYAQIANPTPTPDAAPKPVRYEVADENGTKLEAKAKITGEIERQVKLEVPTGFEPVSASAPEGPGTVISATQVDFGRDGGLARFVLRRLPVIEPAKLEVRTVAVIGQQRIPLKNVIVGVQNAPPQLFGTLGKSDAIFELPPGEWTVLGENLAGSSHTTPTITLKSGETASVTIEYKVEAQLRIDPAQIKTQPNQQVTFTATATTAFPYPVPTKLQLSLPDDLEPSNGEAQVVLEGMLSASAPMIVMQMAQTIETTSGTTVNATLEPWGLPAAALVIVEANDPAVVTPTATPTEPVTPVEPVEPQAPPIQADLEISKTVDQPIGNVTVPLTYTISVRNNGPQPAEDVRVLERLPATVRLETASSGNGDCGAIQPNVLECTLGTLQPGETGLILIVVTPLEPGSITNSAQVSSVTPDPNSANNIASLVSEIAPAPAKLVLTRSSIQPSPALPGEIITVRLLLSNDGGTPSDFSLRDEPSELLQALEPTVFSGRLEPGANREFSYQARVLPGTPGTSTLRARAQGDGPELEANAQFERANLNLEKRFTGSVVPRPGQPVPFLITVKNPLDRAIKVLLTGEAPGMSLTPEENLTLELKALETQTLEVIGRSDTPGVYTNSVRLSIEDLPVAPDAAASASVSDLPERVRRSDVGLRVWARDLPAGSQLIIVDHIPETGTYLPGSSRIRFDGDAADIALPDPLISDNKLFWLLDQAAASQLAKGFTIQYSLAHDGPLEMPKDRLGVILKIPGRTDILRVLEGEPTLANGFLTARAPNIRPASRERIGALIVAPASGTTLRNREQVSVLVDLPLRAKDVRLTVNGATVGDNKVGTRTFDEGTNRLTLEFVAVNLQPGRNELVLTAIDPDNVGPDGANAIVQDQSEIFVSGSVTTLEITAVALTYDPQDKPAIRIKVSDANGLTPADGLITVLVSPEPGIADADPNQPGFQVAFKDGLASIPLSSIGVRSSVKVEANIGEVRASNEFQVTASTRPPFAVGLVSLEARFSSPFTVATSLSAFARSTVFGDSLLTVGIDARGRYVVNGNDTKLTLTGNLQPSSQPYERFPLLGDASRRGSDVNSSDGFYIRLERGPSYLQYGGFDAGFDGGLSAYGAGFNGLSSLLRGNLDQGSTYRLTGFAALVPQSNRNNITLQNRYGTPGDGTSLYRLEGAPIKAGSERISLIVRDANALDIKISERQLERLSEYTIDTLSGVILLQKALNRTDENGNLQYLVVEYASEGSDLPLEFRAGAQGNLEFAVPNADQTQGSFGVKATVLEYSAGKPILFALGLGYASDPKAASTYKLNLEAAWSGALGLNGDAGYNAPAFNLNARYQDIQVGFEGPNKPDAGRAATLAANWKISPTLEFSASSALSQRYVAPLNISLDGRADLRNDFGGFKIGLGVLGRISNSSNPDAYTVASLLVPLDPFRFGLEQRVPITGGTSGQTVFTIAYAITQEFSLEFRDIWTYNTGNAGSLGFKGRLGNTNLSASYELPNEGGQAGRARIGVDTNIPITPNLSAQLGAEYATPFNQTSTLGMNVGLNLTVDTTRAGARAQYNLSERGLKQVYTFGGVLQPITGPTPLLISPSLEYTNGPEGEGTKFSLAGAYRGEQWTALTNHSLRLGLYVPGASTPGDASLEGELQTNFSPNEYFSVRGGAAYKWGLEVFTYQVNAGGTWFITDPLGISANAAFLSQPSTNTSKTSLGLEVNFKLITNLVVSAGYNFLGFDGLGTLNTQQGFYVRLDWKFDERTFWGDPNPTPPSECCPK